MHLELGAAHPGGELGHQLLGHFYFFLGFGRFLLRDSGGGGFKFGVILHQPQQDAEFPCQEVQFFQHPQGFFRREFPLVNGHVAHFADIVEGIDEHRVCHITGKSDIGDHFKGGKAIAVPHERGIDHLHHELHGLPCRRRTDPRLGQSKLLRLGAVVVQLFQLGKLG